MSERVFRLITGMVLWGVLLVSTIYENNTLMIVFCLILFFEGLTNWRIPTLITKLRHGHQEDELNNDLDNTLNNQSIESENSNFVLTFKNLEAERVMRFIVILFLFISFFTFPDILWFFPWYVAGMMIVSGISNICPMVMFLHWVGFR